MRAEIENSSLHDSNQFTICGRFRTPFLPVMNKNMTIQTLLSGGGGNFWFWNRIEMRDCEKDRYEGCTNYYKEKIGTLHTFSYKQALLRFGGLRLGAKYF